MSNRILFAIAGVLVLGAVLLAVRGTSTPDVAPPEPIPTEPPEPAHPWQDAALDPGPDGLQVAVLKEGAGDPPVAGDLVELEVKGWVASLERQFVDTSGRPLRVVVGDGDLVAGLEKTVLAMKPGETRQVHVPSALGYGQTGNPPEIPRDADLVYEVTLVSVADALEVPESPPDVAADQPVEGAAGAMYGVVKAGDGPAVKAGDTVTLHFTTWLEDGTFVDSSIAMHRPITITAGKGEMYAGLDAALIGMQAGEVRKAVIPAAHAFGEKGRGPVPGGATLVLEIRVSDVK